MHLVNFAAFIYFALLRMWIFVYVAFFSGLVCAYYYVMLL